MPHEMAEAAWLAYRDEQQRRKPWCDGRRLGRQMRKRDFIAGYLAAGPEILYALATKHQGINRVLYIDLDRGRHVRVSTLLRDEAARLEADGE